MNRRIQFLVITTFVVKSGKQLHNAGRPLYDLTIHGQIKRGPSARGNDGDDDDKAKGRRYVEWIPHELVLTLR